MKTLDDLILDAVTPVVKPCVQDLYTGEAVEDFTAPDITNATDQTGQHYVFEFEAIGQWMGGCSDG